MIGCCEDKTPSSEPIPPTSSAPPPPPTPPPGWDRCHAYLPRKKRFCRQMISPHVDTTNPPTKPIYCGNHLPILSTTLPAITTAQQSSKRRRSVSLEKKRIPCPVDPSHTIYEHMLRKHVRICPRTKQRDYEQRQTYFRRDINRGGDDDDRTKTRTLLKEMTIARAKRLALRILRVYTTLYSGKTKPANEVTTDELESAIPLMNLSYEEERNGFTQATLEQHRIKCGGIKHLKQLQSLVGHLRRVNFLSNDSHRPKIVLEMGAGRGMLGLIVAGALNRHGRDDDTPASLVMIEKSGSRHKADGRVRCALRDKDATDDAPESFLRLGDLDVRRIKCDLAHVDVPAATPGLVPTPVTDDRERQTTTKSSMVAIAIAKHLCGSGTDLALKSLKPMVRSLKGCAFATCCHGICAWDDYVGKRFLRRVLSSSEEDDFDKQDFDLMRRWSSGTVIPNNEDKEHDVDSVLQPSDCNQTEEIKDYGSAKDGFGVATIVGELNLACGGEGLGRACQRLIDYGRMEYIQKVLGFSNAKLVHYVEKEITPQNALLIGWKDVDGCRDQIESGGKC